MDKMAGHIKRITMNFPDGPEVKNMPASAGEKGLIPGLGRFHMLLGN